MSLGGISVYSDLVSKVAALRKDASELKSEALGGLMVSPPDDESGALSGETKSGWESVDQTSARLEREQKQTQARALKQRVEAAEKDRQSLLEFLQGDMGNTAVLARRMELLEGDLRAAREAETAAKQRAKESESSMLQSRLVVDKQDQQIATLQRAVDELQVDKELLQRERTQLEQVVPQLRDEAHQLRTQVHAANEQLGLAQPRLQQVEPELLRLRKAQSEWQFERSQLLEELGRLQPLAKLLGDVELEFNSKAYVSLEQVPAVSAWSVGPQLRRLSPRLYDYLRLAAQNTYRRETESHEALEARDRAIHDLETFRAEQEAKLAELRSTLERSRVALEEHSHRLQFYERELPDAQRAQQVLAQVRGTLSSFPGGLKGLFTAVEFYPEGGQGMAKDERQYGYSQGFDSRSSAKRSGPGGRTNGGGPSSAAAKPQLVPEMVPDEMLPAVIGKALAHNFNAVTALRDVRVVLDQREKALETTREELHKATRRSEARKEAIDELRSSLASMQSSRSSNEDKLKANLESAAELVENQNMFALMLEAQLEAARKSVASLTKQLETATRNEISARDRLWAALKQGGHSPPSLSPSGPMTSLCFSDILDFTARALVLPSLTSAAMNPSGFAGSDHPSSPLLSGSPLLSRGGGGARTFSEMRARLEQRLATADGSSPGRGLFEKDTSYTFTAANTTSQSQYGETSHFITSATLTPESKFAMSSAIRGDRGAGGGGNGGREALSPGGFYTQPRTFDVLTPRPLSGSTRPGTSGFNTTTAFQDRLREASLSLQALRE